MQHVVPFNSNVEAKKSSSDQDLVTNEYGLKEYHSLKSEKKEEVKENNYDSEYSKDSISPGKVGEGSGIEY